MKFDVAIALLWAAAAVGLGSSSAIAVPTGADAWESFPPANLPDCHSIDRSLLVPVPTTHRSEAIARLNNTSFVELTRPQMVALVGREVGSGEGLLKNEIQRLREQRREALQNHRGSWSLYDQQRLDSVSKTMSHSAGPRLRPFLVRAVAKYEGTGGFGADMCGTSLSIVHGSLGHSTPPSIRAPIVVFLPNLPAKVYVSWQMAE